MKPLVNAAPGSRAEKAVHYFYWTCVYGAALLFNALGKPAVPASMWVLGIGLPAAALAAFSASRGTRTRRFKAWAMSVLSLNAVVVTGTAVVAVHRGEDQYGLLVLGVLWLLLGALPIVAPRQRRAEAVRRLSGLDYALRTVELPGRPMNAMMVWTVEPRPTVDSASLPLDLDRLRRHVAGRIGAVPAFGSRLAAVPFGLSHPVYVPDHEFDIANHVEEHFLGAPGTDEALDAFCAKQAGRHLDSRRPLWRLTLVHGLDGGRQAVVLVSHHCISDGFAVLNIAQTLFGQLGSDTTSVPLPGPTRRAKIGEALTHQAQTAHRLPALVRTGKAAAAAAKTATADALVRPPEPADTPYCMLNEPLTAGRTFARTSLATSDLERVKEAAGVSINDVMLALVAEAFRAYLAARGNLPTRPLVAAVPVGLDRPNSPPRTSGNRVGLMMTTLATDIADPWERLIRIGSVTARAKRLLVIRRPELAGEWLDQLPPLILKPVVRYQLRRESRPGTASSNVIVTHIREMRPIEAMAGAPVVGGYGVGPSNGGSGGPMVAFTSHPDRLLVAVLGVDTAISAPYEFTAGLHQALADLLNVAAARAAIDAEPREPSEPLVRSRGTPQVEQV